MPWSNSASRAETLTTSFATIQNSAGLADFEITLNPRELADVTFDIDSNGTTDDVEIRVITSPDGGTTYQDDDNAALRFTVEVTSASVNQRPSVQLIGVEKVKFRARKTGSTDTITCKVFVNEDGVSA